MTKNLRITENLLAVPVRRGCAHTDAGLTGLEDRYAEKGAERIGRFVQPTRGNLAVGHQLNSSARRQR
jgi:hypothetical protein